MPGLMLRSFPVAEANFDRWIERRCLPYYEQVEKRGQRSIPPGVYFRMLLVGYFEGLDSQRGIAWRCADSLALRTFLGYALTEELVMEGGRPKSLKLRDCGVLRARQGKTDEAIRHFEAALALDPSDEGVRRNLERARREGRPASIGLLGNDPVEILPVDERAELHR